jgi:hypothetical protein
MVAVKVTAVPVHTTGGVADEVIVIPAGTIGLTIWVIVFEVTGLVTGQGMLDVSWQVITFPLAGTYVKVD